jgi:ferredoxin
MLNFLAFCRYNYVKACRIFWLIITRLPWISPFSTHRRFIMTGLQIAPEREKKLAELAAMMNTRHHRPFPITKLLLGCFDAALTPDELNFCLKMGTEAFTADDISPRSMMRKEVAEPLFKGLVLKGFFWPQPKTGEKEEYALAGIMLGWFEIFLSDGTNAPEKIEFARRLDEFMKSFGKLNRFPVRNLLNYRMKRVQPVQAIVAIENPSSTRTIAVHRAVKAVPMKIYPSQTVLELIEKLPDPNSIALVHCFCRHYHKLVGESCRFEMPPESCMAIGPLSKHAVNNGLGRSISKEEARALIQELEKKGAVHQVFHECEDLDRPEIAICNCCWDCCGVFGSYNRGYMPLQLKSYFEARLIDSSLCTGCETCADHCPVQAIVVKDAKAVIQEGKCIGCGQCELQCPAGAIELVPHERHVFLPLRKMSEARIAS